MKSKNRFFRPIVQLFFFILIAIISTNHVLNKKGMSLAFIPDASLHALCPFGGIVSVYQFMTVGTFVQKIHSSAFVLMAILIFMSIAFGGVFCGWICPFGTFQEWIGKIGKKIFGKRYNNFIPEKADKYLRYTRYVVLLWVIYVTAVSGKLMFSNVDPYHALFNFWSGEVAVQAFMILGITIIASLLIERPWCKYACPLGAFIGIFNTFRVFKITRNESKCISCKKCDKACPMNINISQTHIVKDHQCIGCLECTSDMSCPVNSTVNFKLKPHILFIVLVVLLFGGIYGSMELNLWHTESSKVPAKIASGSFKGSSNPEDIRGSYSFSDISKSFDIPLESLGKAFGLNENDNIAAFKCKNLETKYTDAKANGFEIGTGSVRLFVALYKGIPVELEDSYLPNTAIEVLKAEASLGKDQIEYLDSHSVDVSN